MCGGQAPGTVRAVSARGNLSDGVRHTGPRLRPLSGIPGAAQQGGELAVAARAMRPDAQHAAPGRAQPRQSEVLRGKVCVRLQKVRHAALVFPPR